MESEALVEKFLTLMRKLKKKSLDRGEHASFPTFHQFVLMKCLEREEEITAGEVAEKLGLPPSNITVMIDRLEKSGLVRRWRGEKDRRVVFLGLTPRGREILEEMRREHNRLLAKTFSVLTPQEAEQLASLLEKIIKGLEED
ncbi:MAG: hypothetical protein PWQ91_375 [Eubacteriales bacterium]|nr:hypothetical protein [Eubacteriales bacterium]